MTPVSTTPPAVRRRVAPAVVLALAGAAVLGGCATTGPQGEQSLVLFSPEQEVQMGQQLSQQVDQEFEVLDDRAVQQYVDGLGQHLAQYSGRDEIDFKFEVLDDPMVNAFAAPGGWIYVTTGLMRLAETEAELAGVLAHEIGHISGRHTVRQLQTAYGLDILNQLLLGDAGTVAQLASQIGGSLYMLEHSRDAELESDEFAIKYMLAAGYDPRALATFFGRLLEAKEEEPSGLLTWFQTHPTTEKRIDEVNALLADRYQADYAQLAINRGRYREIKARLPEGGDSVARRQRTEGNQLRRR